MSRSSLKDWRCQAIAHFDFETSNGSFDDVFGYADYTGEPVKTKNVLPREWYKEGVAPREAASRLQKVYNLRSLLLQYTGDERIDTDVERLCGLPVASLYVLATADLSYLRMPESEADSGSSSSVLVEQREEAPRLDDKVSLDYSGGMSEYTIIQAGPLGQDIEMEITGGEGHENDSGSLYWAWDKYDDAVRNPLFYKWLEEHNLDPKAGYMVYWSW